MTVNPNTTVSELKIEEVYAWLGQMQVEARLLSKAIAERDEQIKKLQAEIIRLQANK